jgi:hypothetical protein
VITGEDGAAGDVLKTAIPFPDPYRIIVVLMEGEALFK